MESLTGLEDYIFAAAEAYRKGTEERWKACQLVWQAYERFGLYTRELTSFLSEELCVGKDAVQNLRRAWEVRRSIQAHILPTLLERLSYSHFYTCYKYVDYVNVQEFLELAVENNWSQRDLQKALSEVRPQENDEWGIKLARTCDNIWRFYEDSEMMGLSEEQRTKLKQAAHLLRALKNELA